MTIQKKQVVSKEELKERAIKMITNPTETEFMMFQLLKEIFGKVVKTQVVLHPYIVDFLVDRFCLVVEVDGSQHLENKEYDKKRDSWLEKRFRVKVLRISAEAVRDTGRVKEIRRIIRESANEAILRFPRLQKAKNQTKRDWKEHRKAQKLAKTAKEQKDKKKIITIPDPEIEQKRLAYEAIQKERLAKEEAEKKARLERLYARTF